MKRIVWMMVVLLVCTATGTHAASQSAHISSAPFSTYTHGVNKSIPDHYIVVLTPDTDVQTILAHIQVKPKYTFQTTLNGFAAQLTPRQVRMLNQRLDVASIEADQVMKLDATQIIEANGGAWGLDRIDQHMLPLSRNYATRNDGTGVTAYVIDSGLQADHPEFGARAANVYDAFGGTGQDCHGHGTHVAGIVGASTYGVAKDVRLRGVRVLDCSGTGSFSSLIAGLEWVRTNAVKPAVATISLSGGYSASVNTAVTNLVDSGVFVAVAAGNTNTDACTVSPASTSSAYTVAASDTTDTRSAFSNYGSCVDSYAPGVSVTSTWLNSSVQTRNGTSMASPYVAGVAALYKSTHGDVQTATITTWLNTNATSKVIVNNPKSTPNRLLYTGGL